MRLAQPPVTLSVHNFGLRTFFCLNYIHKATRKTIPRFCCNLFQVCHFAILDSLDYKFYTHTCIHTNTMSCHWTTFSSIKTQVVLYINFFGWPVNTIKSTQWFPVKTNYYHSKHILLMIKKYFWAVTEPWR